MVVLNGEEVIGELTTVLPRCAPAVQRRFRSVIRDAQAMSALVQAIVQVVRDDPGCVQSRLGRRIGADQEECRNACWYLERFGVIVRTKFGNSYVLHPADG